ncbi:MAG: LysR family transcriptional regulator, partial [Coriobacteriales bacterium]|nr:LysR family transcriptional regulator [Coriobacteriales bacterium]
ARAACDRRLRGLFSTGEVGPEAAMQIDYIREFVYLANGSNFSETAKTFYISQSALSKHIAALEKELGGRLLVRDNHQVRLTNIGRVFYDGMADVLERYDRTIADINRTHDGFTSTIRIGYLYEATRDFFLPACEMLRKKHGDLGIETRAYEVEGVLAALRRGTIDVGITAIPPDKDFGDLHVYTLRKAKFFVAVSKANRLSTKERVSFSDLDDIDVLFPHPYVFPELSAYLHRRLKDTQIAARAVETAHDSKSIVPFLSMYNGAALIIEHSIPELGEGFKVLELEDVDLSISLAVIWKKGTESQSIRAFIACLNDALAQAS